MQSTDPHPRATRPAHAQGTSTARRLRHALTAAIVAVPLLLGAAACSDEDEGTTIEFFWWGGDARATMTQQALDLYQSKHPDVKINATWQTFDGYYDKLATISGGGNAPDIFQIDDNGLAEYAGRNVTLDLTPYVESKKLDLSDHYEGLTAYGQIDGKQVAVATGENTPALVYDKTKLAELGVDEPKEGWTYDEYITWAASVTEKSGGEYFGSMDPSSDYKALWLWLRSQGKEFYNGNQLAFTAEDLTAWFTLWQQAREKGATPPADVVHEAVTGSVDTQLVVTGKGATSFMWSNQLGELGKATESELAMVPYPGDVKGQWARASTYWAGSRATEHPEIVADIINFLTNDPEAGAILGTDRGLPPNKTTRATLEAAQTDPYAKAVFAFENGMASKFGPAPAPPPKGHSGLRNTLRDIAESVTYETATPADAAAQFFTEATAALSG